MIGGDAGYLNALGWRHRWDEGRRPRRGAGPDQEGHPRGACGVRRRRDPATGSRGGVRWPSRYFVRRVAWHAGPHGVPVAWLHSTGIPEALADIDRFPDCGAGEMTREEVVSWMRGTTMLNRLTSLEDVGNAAAFLASDRAGAMAASAVNVTSGFVPTR
ncbi:MAG: hypothetical protein ACRDKA_00965 [Actinomycetota bacterium]